MYTKLLLVFLSIPALFGLFLLAIYNVLLMLAAVAIILGVIMVLKKKRPNLFMRNSKSAENEEKNISSENVPFNPQIRTYVTLVTTSNADVCRVAVNKRVFTIGRDAGNDYVIPEVKISRQHLQIIYDESNGMCFARDMHSSNSTFINGERMNPDENYLLTDGDRLQIGNRAFIVEYAHY